MSPSFYVSVDFAGKQQKPLNPESALCLTRPASSVNCFRQAQDEIIWLIRFAFKMLFRGGFSRLTRK
jgi:hypothetical protein